MFNRDQALSADQQEGDDRVGDKELVDPKSTAIKATMEKRAYAYKDEVNNLRKTGERGRSHNNPLWKHFDAEKHR